jgi:methylase of polypeptide subunit release factors
MYLTKRLGADDRLRFKSKSLKVLDLCTGTGCIPLLFARTFSFTERAVNRLDVLGVDISYTAVELARHNQRSTQQQHHHHIADLMDDPPANGFEIDCQRDALSNAKFLQADILSESGDPSRAIDLVIESRDNHANQPVDIWTALHREGYGNKWDIIISNPPYISPKHFYTTTTRSVRNYEPKLALVPPPMTPHLTDEQQGDLFYPRLLHLANKFKSKMLLMEVADLEQAERVSALVLEGGNWSDVEIWCDEPGLPSDPQRKSCLCDVPILGQGNGRSVFCWRED